MQRTIQISNTMKDNTKYSVAMKYQVKFWNDSTNDFQILGYPYLDTALMMANKLCHKLHDKVFVTDGTTRGCYVIEQ